jgi:3-hydroxybutyryl-CoA dehydrogenase
MPLVELIRTPKTSEEVSIKFRQLALQLGKKPVLCRDLPGFIVNRVARSYYLEALRLAETGTVSFETIDQIMESAGFRLGPFRLMDLIGNDTNYAVSCSVYEAMGRPPRLEPSGLQKEMTLNNELGKKTGKGYYLYP